MVRPLWDQNQTIYGRPENNTIPPTEEENRVITLDAMADPDNPPLTDKELEEMRPMVVKKIVVKFLNNGSYMSSP